MKTDIRVMSKKDLDDMNERARMWKEFIETGESTPIEEIAFPEDCES